MCHLILLLPLIGLPLFWLLPLSYALPLYLAIVFVSIFLYRLMMKAMRRPLHDDFRSLIGSRAEVVSRLGSSQAAQYLVRARGELWSAYSADSLQLGEQVNIMATKGIGVIVEPAENGHNEPDKAKTGLSGAIKDAWHCH